MSGSYQGDGHLSVEHDRTIADISKEVSTKPYKITNQTTTTTSIGSSTKLIATPLREIAERNTSQPRVRINTKSISEESHFQPPSSSIQIQKHFPESVKSAMSALTQSDECHRVKIPMPILPHETRKGKFVQSGVSGFCLIMSLIITLTCGRGQLGLGAASFMFNNAIVEKNTVVVQKNLRSKIVNDYPKLPMPIMSVVIPSVLESNMADVGEGGTGNVVFWFIPKSGARTLGIFLFQCIGLVEASNMGYRSVENELKILEDRELNIRYVNVDTTTKEGLSRAKNLNLASSGIADVIGTPLVSEVVHIFDPLHQGRFITIIRDPIDRAMALFEDEKQRNPNSGQMTIADFVESTKYQDNFLTRSLTNKLSDELIDADLLLAQAILHKKFVIGIFDRMDESLVRFENYFGWNKLVKTEYLRECMRSNMVNQSRSTSNDYPGPFSLPIIRQNEYDLKLYDFAKDLFELQGSLIQQ